MKPEAWVIEDIGRLRKQKIRTKDEDSYLSLLLWYVQDAIKLVKK